MKSFSLLCTFLSGACCHLVAATSTLESFLTFPNRANLVSTAGRAAWVEIQNGQINVFGAFSVDRFSSFQMSNHSGDAGMAINDLQFSRDGDLLFYTYGPSDDANPTHEIVPPTQQMVVLSFKSSVQPTRLLGPHVIVAVAASGDAVAHAETSATGVTVFETNLTTGTVSSLFRSKHGSISSASWSPDGQTLVFSNNRFDHGYIGLFQRGSTRLRWIAPSIDTDVEPVWSPSGDSIAFFRMRGSSVDSDGKLHQGQSFSVLVARVPGADKRATRRGPPHMEIEALEAFRDFEFGFSGGGDNGFGVRPLLWAGEDTLVFPSETSGFVHAVAATRPASADGGGSWTVRDLTPGQCEHQDWIYGDGGWLYLSHNCDNVNSLGIKRVHLFSNQVRGMLGRHTPPNFCLVCCRFFLSRWWVRPFRRRPCSKRR
jgi:dipeptidyl aminopeptidase/acylaminoacyl peptidase